jgi:hypothetical protein
VRTARKLCTHNLAPTPRARRRSPRPVVLARRSQLQTNMDVLGYAFLAASCLFLGLIVAPIRKPDTDMLGRIAIVAVW